MTTAFDRPAIESSVKRFIAADLSSLPTDLPSGTVDYELDNGRLLTRVPPGDVHGSIQAHIVTELKIQGERQGHGKARAEVGIVLWRDRDRVVGADAAFIANASLPIAHSPEGYLKTIPDLIVEVKSKNDSAPYIERKVDDYLASQVKIVWVADPDRQTVTVFSFDAAPRVYTSGEKLTCDFVPGFELMVDDVFRV